MIAGAVSAVYVGTALVHRISERLLEWVILAFLVVIGAVVGGFLVGVVPAAALKLVLGVILIASAIRIFRGH